MRTALRRAEAAKYITDNYGIPCSTGTLANYATADTGPEFKLAGRFPIYSTHDLDAWAQSRISAPRRSGAEARAA